MNISWFVPVPFKFPWQKKYNYNKMSASVWIRCLQLFPYLEKLGVKSRINSYNSETDIAIFLRNLGGDMIRLAQDFNSAGKKVILDTPVNYFSDQQHPALVNSNMDGFKAMADIADIITCPTDFIADFGQKKGYRTKVIEDSINLKHFNLRRTFSVKKEPVLVWCGVDTKASVLELLASSLDCNNWKMLVISNDKPKLSFDFHYEKWDYSNFPKSIIRGDVAVFPRQVDNDYDKGHSFFKIGVFLAEHVPVVYSPVPSYKKITTSSNSTQIDSLEEKFWEEQIKKILDKNKPDFSNNPVYQFSTEKIADKYLELFSEILSKE